MATIATGRMHKPECKAGHMPVELIDGIRDCLESGINATQLIAFLGLIAGLFRIGGQIDEDELIGRCAEVIRVMRGWMDYQHRQARFHGD